MTVPHPPGHLTNRDFRSDAEKWEYLRRAPELDCLEAPIFELALHLWEAARADVRAFAQLAHAYARDVIRYMSDIQQFGEEDIAPAGGLSDVLARGVDDCDAKARLFVALCRAVHVAAEMQPKWRGEILAHVFARVRIAGAWMPVELTLARAKLGEDAGEVPREVSGRWDMNEAYC